ncbi:hypothetical protein CHS0354_002214 [Potamilus streckersoni]|uniref:TNF family profile domain-containing protein n=1 Tax=Potamilus streckersoni TaxID=2493646 RepID=A0AAE0VI17_9BIVA|nr:hypothetical protein CHS0354_002214 [Potamilus streckersoni]
MDCILVPEKSQTKTFLVRHGGKERCCSGRISSHLGHLGGVFVLLLLIFVPNLYLILRTEKLQSELSVQKDIIDTLVKKFPQTGYSLEQSESIHNHKNHPKNHNSTSWRSKRSGCGTASFIHLFGTGASYNEERKFKWKRARKDRTFSNQNPIGLEFVEDRGSILAIRVTESGFYMVYSKIHAKGRKNNDNIPNVAVGYHVKVDRQMPDRTVTTFTLSMSFITQDERGKPYQSLPAVNRLPTPVDEVTDIGVYYLEESDEIYIQASPDSNNFDWSSSEDKANFGILQLC